MWRGLSWSRHSLDGIDPVSHSQSAAPLQLPTVMAFQMLAHLSGLSRALQLADTPGPCLPDPWSSPDHATHVTGLDLLLWVKLSHFFLSLQSIWCRFWIWH